MKTQALPQSALIGFPNSPASVTAYAQQFAGGDLAISVQMAVNDQALRDALANQKLDGLESPFVWMKATSGEYKAFKLKYDGTVQASGTRPTVDHYSIMLGTTDGVDPLAAINQGYAVGLDTNEGRVWLQLPGETFTVRI